MESIVTVITPAASQDLTVLATAKEELGVTNSASDTKIARWIREASSEIATYCDRVFGLETVDETLFFPTLGPYPEGVFLSRYPVQGVVTVTADGELVDPAGYTYDPRLNRIFRMQDVLTRTTWSGYSTVFRYTAGYDLLDSLPFDIERACLQLVKSYHFKLNRDASLREEDVPGVLRRVFFVDTSGKQTSIPPEVQSMLDPYRRIVIA